MLFNIEPLRMWVHKVLPVVYDDSLSYYEVLAKTVKKLNEVIDLTDEQTKFIQEFSDNLTDAINEWEEGLTDEWTNYKNRIDEEWENYKSNTNEDIEIWKHLKEVEIERAVAEGIYAFAEYFEGLKNQAIEAADRAEDEADRAEAAADNAVEAVMPTLEDIFDNRYALKSAIGSPLVANTAAEMTDTNRIYVYVGSEEGYVNGNWYYYDGTAWTSGGVYNSVAVVTDPTLSESGVPADAKATGDAVTVFKNTISEWSANIGIWSSGGINASGTDANNDTHLRTTYIIPTEYSSVKVDVGYELYLTAYTIGGEYVGKYCTDGQFHTTFTSATVLWTNKFNLSDYPNYKLRLVMRSTTEPTPNITRDEAIHCLFWHNKIDMIDEKVNSLTGNDCGNACLALLRSLAYLDGQKKLYAAFEEALQPNVKRLNVVFTQGNNKYGANQSLNQFRNALTVTVTYADGSTAIINEYYLEGTLSLGENTITIRYGGKKATFTVNVEYLYVLREGDFERNTNCASQEVAGELIPYSRNVNTRIAYINFDLFLDGGKTYEIVTTVTSNYESTAQVGIPIYNERFYNDAVDWIVANHTNDVRDDGWKTLNYNLTLPTNINNSPTKGVRFAFRQSDNNPTISDDFAIEMLTIREVTV